MADEKKGDLTVREAGRKGGQRGGQTTKARYGHEFYTRIGRKGGETVRDKRGHEFYEEIGRKGGQRVRQLIEEGRRQVWDRDRALRDDRVAPEEGIASHAASEKEWEGAPEETEEKAAKPAERAEVEEETPMHARAPEGEKKE